MDALRKEELEGQCQAIRASLKEWEHDWSASNGGAKPSRDAIKANADIARKYKEYNKLRDIISGKIKEESVSTKRKSAPPPVQTPVKRSKYSRPTETRQKEDIPPVASTPSRHDLAPSPVVPTSIGPTPHRDGKVLGLFAFLDTTNPVATPSRRDGEAQAKLLETPSRGSEIENFKLGRTPTSSSKRQYLDLLVTPLKTTDGNARAPHTPQSVSKLQFGTPAFLRRKTLPAVEEAEEYESPKKLRRISRKPFARGLSAIVANLRKVEEEHLEAQFNDDEAAMREMEAESFAATQPEPKKPVEAVPIVPDSQPGVKLLGGFDDENAYDSPVEDQTDRGRPIREFKKKAPKRTTRKVIMRPIFSKRPTETQPASESDFSDEEDAPVPETQVDATALGAPLADDSDGHSDFTPDHDHDEVAALAKAIRAGRKRTTKALDEEAAQAKKEKGKTKATEKDKATDKDKDEGKVRKVARKVNELAHANFRRLKLRNNGAKGGPGYNSRFRRR